MPNTGKSKEKPKFKPSSKKTDLFQDLTKFSVETSLKKWLHFSTKACEPKTEVKFKIQHCETQSRLETNTVSETIFLEKKKKNSLNIETNQIN